MGCTKTLDFAPSVSGAHLSFYWPMDEAGGAPKLDSTSGLAWPLAHGASGTPGLFSNGTNIPPSVVLTFNPGLVIFGTPAITINQAVSKGISAWWWIKPNAYTTQGVFFLDTDDFGHTNQFSLGWSLFDALNGFMEVEHQNDTDDVFVDTPNLAWSLGSWHMVAITYNKVAQTLNIYVDGALSATIADAFTYPDLTNSDFILWSVAGPLNTSDQTVDEFGLCLNGALTPAQVTALWNGGAGMTWPTVTTVVPFP